MRRSPKCGNAANGMYIKHFLEFANIPSTCTDAPMVQGISIHHVYHFTILHIVSSSFSLDIGLTIFAGMRGACAGQNRQKCRVHGP